MAHPVAVEFAFHGFCGFLCRVFPDLQIRAHDIHRDTFGLYHRLRGGHDFALFPTRCSQALSSPLFSAVSVFGNFGVPGDDDLAGTGNLVAAFNLVRPWADHLFYLQPFQQPVVQGQVAQIG